MLNYRIEGNGPPLALIHGWGITYNIWQNLAPLLRDHFRLIMIELPCVGGPCLPAPEPAFFEQCADAVDEVRRALGVEQWSVLSYSVGAHVGASHARRAGAHIRRAVYLCPAIVNAWRIAGLRILIAVDRRWPASSDWLLSGWRLYNLLVWLGFNGRPHPIAAEWFAEFNSRPKEGLKVGLRAMSAEPFRGLDEPRANALFVWGSSDRIVDRPRRLEGNHRIIAADHSAPMLAADDVARAVREFLA